MTQILTVNDQFNIKDVLKQHQNQIYKQKRKSPFVGMVRIYEDGILNTDQSEDGWLFNMTIAAGREFANQAIFKSFSNVLPSSSLGDISEYKVNAFSVGSNGSTIDVNDNITLLGPNVCDLESTRPIELNTACYKNRSAVPNIVKLIKSSYFGDVGNLGTITHEYSSDIEFTDCANTYYTVTKSVCKVESGEPLNLSPGDVVKIDEAFLYATHPEMDHTTDATIYKPVPFAHICFAPKFVEKESVFIIEWFIIF
jgi:hypothetical protein